MGTRIYLATSKGVATVQEDSGNWVLTSQALGQWDVTEIAVDPSNANRIYAGTRGDGILVSEDGGQNWTKPNRGKPGPGKVRCVTIDPHDPDTLWVGTEPIGMWISIDRGANWQELQSVRNLPSADSIDYPVPAVEPHVRDIVIDHTNPDNVFASLQVGYMIKSQDRGETWTLLNKGIDPDVHTIALSPADPNKIYVTTGGEGYREGIAPGRSLYRTSDGGDSWTPIAMEFDQEYSVPLAVNPINPDIIYASLAIGNPGEWLKHPDGAQSSIVRSNDGGESWHALDAGPIVSKQFAVAIAVDQEHPDNVFAATRGGDLVASSDGGDSWYELGVQVPQAADIKVASV